MTAYHGLVTINCVGACGKADVEAKCATCPDAKITITDFEGKTLAEIPKPAKKKG